MQKNLMYGRAASASAVAAVGFDQWVQNYARELLREIIIDRHIV